MSKEKITIVSTNIRKDMNNNKWTNWITRDSYRGAAVYLISIPPIKV